MTSKMQFIRDAVASSTNDCIVWPFNVARNCKYGYLRYGGKNVTASRLSLILHTGTNPQELHACHSPSICHNPLCVNPRHLRWATRAENMADKHLDNVQVGRPRLEDGTQLDHVLAMRVTPEEAAEISSRGGSRWAREVLLRELEPGRVPLRAVE